MKSVVGLLALCCLGAHAFAEASSFRIVAKTGDPKPLAGIFSHFSPPIYDGETIGFRDDDESEYYKALSGAPILVAKLGDHAPSFDSNYVWFDHYRYWDALRPARQGIPFRGQASKVGFGICFSIFSDIDQPNSLAAEYMMAPDDGFVRMYGYGFASDNRNVLYSGGTTVSGPYQGLYWISGGVVKLIADSRTVVPMLGTTMDNITSTGDIRGEYAIGTVTAPRLNMPTWTGILRYRLSNGGIDYPVTFEDLLVPAGESSQQIGFWPSLSETGRIVFFIAGYSASQNTYQRAIYMWQEDYLTKIVDPQTPLPQGNGNFSYDNLSSETVISTSQDRIAFSYILNSFLGTQGIYLWNQGTISRVVAPGVLIGGKQVSNVFMTRSMLAGHKVAFKATFTDGSQAVVIANTCVADLNGDDQVDDSDFVLFAAAYNILLCDDAAMPANCPADLNTDTYVDDADFVIFAAAYDALLCP